MKRRKKKKSANDDWRGWGNGLRPPPCDGVDEKTLMRLPVVDVIGKWPNAIYCWHTVVVVRILT